jgi:hypothetical protein
MQTRPNGAAREVVATYQRYADAQRAVDALSDRGFDVQGLTIEGRGLRIVEHVTGRMNLGRAALQGAASGATLGLLLGVIFGLLNWFAPARSALIIALWGLLIGAFWGALFGLLAHRMSRGTRDFESVSAMEAETYDVTAPSDVAVEARRLLAELGVGSTSM